MSLLTSIIAVYPTIYNAFDTSQTVVPQSSVVDSPLDMQQKQGKEVDELAKQLKKANLF